MCGHHIITEQFVHHNRQIHKHRASTGGLLQLITLILNNVTALLYSSSDSPLTFLFQTLKSPFCFPIQEHVLSALLLPTRNCWCLSSVQISGVKITHLYFNGGKMRRKGNAVYVLYRRDAFHFWSTVTRHSMWSIGVEVSTVLLCSGDYGLVLRPKNIFLPKILCSLPQNL